MAKKKTSKKSAPKSGKKKPAKKKAPSKKPKKKEEPQTFERDPEVLEEIVQTSKELDVALLDLAEKEALHKQAKAKATALHDRLYKLAKEYRESDRSPRLPFSQGDEAPDATEPVDPDDDAWRGVTLESLGIIGKTLEHLEANEPPITTIGAVCDFQAKPYKPNQLLDIKGIGKAAAQKIEDAVAKYWIDNPRRAPEQEQPGQDGDEKAAAEGSTEEDTATG